VYTEMIEKCRNLIDEIDQKFEPFTKLYLSYDEGNITYEEMLNQMRKIIEPMNDSTMEAFNEMHKMYSTTNCAWYSYKTGEIIHKLLLEKWSLPLI